MLGIGCPDRHALPLTPLHRSKCTDRVARHPATARSFFNPFRTFGVDLKSRPECPENRVYPIWFSRRVANKHQKMLRSASLGGTAAANYAKPGQADAEKGERSRLRDSR